MYLLQLLLSDQGRFVGQWRVLRCSSNYSRGRGLVGAPKEGFVGLLLRLHPGKSCGSLIQCCANTVGFGTKKRWGGGGGEREGGHNL